MKPRRRNDDSEKFLTTDQIVRSANAKLMNAVGAVQICESGSECVNPERSAKKCQSCGSHEYMKTSGILVCAYCRIPQSGFRSRPQVEQNRYNDMLMSRLECIYDFGVIDPDLVIRISNIDDEGDAA